MVTIETAAKRFADEHKALCDLVGQLNEGLEALKRQALPAIKRAVARTAERQAELSGLVDQGRHLFVRPRTVIFHGIKVGLEKGKGKIEWDDEERVIKLIRKHLPEQAEGLIKTEEYVSKGALKGLTVAELKLIGCTVEETDDQVVIRPTDSDVDKVVRAMLKEAGEVEGA